MSPQEQERVIEYLGGETEIDVLDLSPAEREQYIAFIAGTTGYQAWRSYGTHDNPVSTMIHTAQDVIVAGILADQEDDYYGCPNCNGSGVLDVGDPELGAADTTWDYCDCQRGRDMAKDDGILLDEGS